MTSPDPSATHVRLPLRLRITLWVLAIFAVVHVTFALAFILFHGRMLTSMVDGDLRSAARHASAARVGAEAVDDVLADERAGKWGPLVIGVVDAEGQTVASVDGRNKRGLGTLLDVIAASPTDSSIKGRSHGFQYVVEPLADGGRLLIAAPGREIHRARNTVSMVFLLALPVGLFSVGISTWVVAGLAIRPIEQVQQFAEDLTAETVSEGVKFDDVGPEIEALRAELDKAMARLREGFDSQARFLANVSHELKTPISVIQTEAEVLLYSEPTVEELTEFAASAADEAARLGKMIESFLLLTRIRHGESRVKPRPHDANDLLMESIAQTLMTAEQYHVKLNPVADESAEQAQVEGNAELIQTSLANLIRNAIRFSPQGGEVVVTCVGEAKTVRYQVRDFGPGVPDELVDRLFEPFTQAAEERRRGRGTGLGLQIAQGIAELHGGRVTMRNQDVGCVFELTLPRVDASSGT